LKTRRNLLLMLVAIPMVIAMMLGVRRLHSPHPRVKAPALIDRNSLLPHLYAGPCINCHRINEVGPIPMNSSNMDVFRLTPLKRRLLLAGQRVDAPTLSQKIRVPAITRTDILPHSFVGVCSNCHVILDLRPSPAFMREAMRRASQPLFSQEVPASAIARAGTYHDVQGERRRRAWGYVALPLCLAALVFIVRRVWARARGGEQRHDPHDALWLTVHEWCAAGFVVAATLHGYYSDRGNNYLHLAFVSLACLIMGGLVLRFRLAAGDIRTNAIVLYVQRLMALGLVTLVMVGHFFATFR
jgi:hypothetical protein